MSQTISLWGATYSNVPGVDLPTSPSGTARFTDVTPTTVTDDSQVKSGKVYFRADGSQHTGTGYGGGGGGSVSQDQDGYIVIPSTGGGGGGNATIETGTFTVLSDISVPAINTTASVTIGFSGQPDFIYCWMDRETFDDLGTYSNNRWYMWWIAKKDSSFATLPPLRYSNTNDVQPYFANSNYVAYVRANVNASSDATNTAGYALSAGTYPNRNNNAYAINNDGTITLMSSTTAAQLVLAGTYNYIAITGATMYPA